MLHLGRAMAKYTLTTQHPSVIFNMSEVSLIVLVTKEATAVLSTRQKRATVGYHLLLINGCAGRTNVTSGKNNTWISHRLSVDQMKSPFAFNTMYAVLILHK